MAKATLAEEKVVALSAARVETIPPTTTMNAPYGINNSAALLMPKSPLWPIKDHAAVLFGGVIAPTETKATMQYIVTTRARDMKIALGIFLLGSLTSSPV